MIRSTCGCGAIHRDFRAATSPAAFVGATSGRPELRPRPAVDPVTAAVSPATISLRPFNGELHFSTPIERVREVAPYFTNGRLVELKGMGR